MPRPVRLTKTLASADDDNVCASQTPGAAGNLTINGIAATGSPAVAVLDTSRQILFTFGASAVGRTFVIYGFDKPTGGIPISETVAGAAATATTVQGFGAVTRVTIDAAFASTVKVGTNGVGWTPWQLVDWNLDPTAQAIQVDVTGTVNYTVQYTYDDILGSYDGGNWSFTPPSKIWDDAVVAAATADAIATYNNPIVAWRVQINSGTGSLAITGIQAGVGGTGS